MAVRHTLLLAAAVLVLGAGLYLFMAVRAQPSDAGVEPRKRDVSARRDPPEAHAQPDKPDKPDEDPIVIEQHHGLLPRHHATPDHRPNLEAGSAAPTEDAPPEDPSKPNPKLDALMVEANRAYDHGDFDEAKQIAQRILAQAPTNVRMLRVVVSASCVDGDAVTAEASYAKLPPGDKAQMRTRCERYGVTFKDAPAPAVAAPK